MALGLLGQGDLAGVAGIARVGWQGGGGGPHPAESGAGQALAAPLVARRPAVALAASHPSGEFWESPAQGGGPRLPALLGSGQRSLLARGTRGLRPELGRPPGTAGDGGLERWTAAARPAVLRDTCPAPARSWESAVRLTLGSPDSPLLWGRTRLDQVPRDAALRPRRTTGWRAKVSLRLCRLVPED